MLSYYTPRLEIRARRFCEIWDAASFRRVFCASYAGVLRVHVSKIFISCRSACFAASRYHLGRGARRALCPHGGRLCAPVGKGAALGGRGRAAGGRRFAQPAGVRFFGAALSGCVPAQRDFVFYAGSLLFRAIEVMLLFRKAHKYFMLHEQAQGSTP